MLTAFEIFHEKMPFTPTASAATFILVIEGGKREEDLRGR